MSEYAWTVFLYYLAFMAAMGFALGPLGVLVANIIYAGLHLYYIGDKTLE